MPRALAHSRVTAAAIIASAAITLTLSVAPARADTPLLVAVGDSYPSGVGVGKSNAWPALAAGALGDDVQNLAVGGSTSRVITDQLQKAGPAEVVVIQTGGNDVQALSSIDSILSGGADEFIDRMPALHDDLVAAYTIARAAQPDAVVFALTYPDFIGPCLSGDVNGAHRAADALNGTITDAADNAGIVTINANHLFDGHGLCSSDPWINGPGDPAPGHPNAAGHAALAKLVTDKISSGLAQRGPSPASSAATVNPDSSRSGGPALNWWSFLLAHRAEIETLLGLSHR